MTENVIATLGGMTSIEIGPALSSVTGGKFPGGNQTTARLLAIHRILDELTSSPYSHDVIELALATATSLSLYEKDHPAPIWLLIVGVPGAGKTESVLALKSLDRVVYVDTMTESSLASGYRNPKDGGTLEKEDLLTKLDGKCLIVKDLTTLFSMREDKVKKILGDFQSIYDGEYAKATGTLGLKQYSSTFAMLGCITPIVLTKHHRYMSTLGGRFLQYRVLPLSPEDLQDGLAISWDEQNREAKLPELRRLIVEQAYNLLRSPVTLKPETDLQKQHINRLANLLAHGRAVLQWEKLSGSSEYEIVAVQKEEPFRAVQQLRTLGRALARVHGQTIITDHELELLRRVVLSSMPADRAEVLALLGKHSDGFTRKACAEGIKKGYHRAKQLLDELVAVGLADVEDCKGENEKLYRPVAKFADLIVAPTSPLDHSLVLDAGTLAINSPQENREI